MSSAPIPEEEKEEEEEMIHSSSNISDFANTTLYIHICI
jgi:hypothetical protein